MKPEQHYNTVTISTNKIVALPPNKPAMINEALNSPVPWHIRTTNETDITWKARKRSRVLDIDISEAGVTLEMITGAVQPLTNDSQILEVYYSCQHCNFCSYDTSKFMDHIYSRSPGTLFQCDLCTFKFCTSSGMRIHTDEMHSLLPRNFDVILSTQPQVQTIDVAKATEAETPPVSVQTSNLLAPKAKSGYQCTHCHKKFWKKVSFQRHLRTHTQDRSFKCDRCNLSFNSQTKMKRHIFARMSVAQKCSFCELTFCFGVSLTKHVKSFHGKDFSDTPVLPLMFNYGEDDEPLVGVPVSEEPLPEKTLNYESIQAKLPGMKCLYCVLTFSTEQLLLQHNNNSHGDASLTISDPTTSIGPQSMLKSLEEDSNNPEIKKCQGLQRICNNDNKNPGSLKVQLLRSRTADRQFQCNRCSYTSSDKLRIERHKQTRGRTEGQLYYCSKCTFKSCTSNYLRMHTIQIHPEEDILAFEDLDEAEPPPLVGTTKTSTNNSWGTHYLQPEIEKTQEVCSYCKKVFGGSNRRWLLEEHIRIHTGEKPFKCSQCSYICAQRSALYHHRRRLHSTTSSIRNNWKKKVPVQRHIRTHTQERSLKCDRCNLSFNNLAKMKRHIFARGGSLQKCNLCELTFCFGSSLTKHVKTSHGNDISDGTAIPALINNYYYGEDDKPIVGHPESEELPDETQICDSIPAKLPGMKCLHRDSTSSNEDLFLQHKMDRCRDSSRNNSTWLQAMTTPLEEYSNNPEIEGSLSIQNICNADFNPLQKDLEEDPINPEIKEFQGKHICSFCNQIFKDRETLEVHLRSHTDGFQCDRCSYTSSTKYKIKRHMESKGRTGREEGQLYNCPKCTFKSCTTHYLRNHFMETHLEEESSSVLEHMDEAQPPLLTPMQTRMEESDNLLQEHLDQSKPPLLKASEEIPTSLVTRPHIKKTWVVCHFCSKKFEGSHRNVRLEEHIRIHTGEKPFKCKECSYTCAQRSAVVCHRRRLHPTTTSSIRNNWKKSNRSALHAHRRRYHLTSSSSISPKNNESILKSSNYSGLTSCSSVMLEKHDLGDHSATVPPEDSHPGNGNMDDKNVQGKPEKPYKCTYCNFRSKYRNNTRAHERIHTGEKPYQCNTCGKQFAHGSSFSKHKRRHLRNQRVGVNVNTLLGRKFNFKLRIIRKPVNTQGNSVEGTRNAVEGTVFTIKPKLYAPPKMYKCKFCPYKSKQHSHIVTHTRIHTGEKPFKCQYCPYRSAREQDLKKHEIRHVARGDERETHQTRPEPHLPQVGSQVPQNIIGQLLRNENKLLFKSRFCNSRSYRSGHTKKNERLHTIGENRFECQTCGCRFTCRRSLFIHKETHYI